MYEHTASDGQRYRYNSGTDRYERYDNGYRDEGVATPAGWFAVDKTSDGATYNGSAWVAPQATAPQQQQAAAWDTPTQPTSWANLFPTNTLQRAAYDQGAPLAWSAASRFFSPNQNTPRADWFNRNQNQFNLEYADASTRNPGANQTLSQFIEQLGPTFGQRFDLQTPGQKGYNIAANPSGRFTG